MMKRSGNIVDIPVGKGTLGWVLDALKNPIDGNSGLKDASCSCIEVKPWNCPIKIRLLNLRSSTRT